MKFRLVENVSVKRTYIVDAGSMKAAQELVMNGEVEPIRSLDDDGGCWCGERLYPVTNGKGNAVEWLDIWSILDIINKDGETAPKYIVAAEVRDNIVEIERLLKERSDFRLDRSSLDLGDFEKGGSL